MAILPGTEFINNEDQPVVLSKLGDLIVDEGEAILELALQPSFSNGGANEFLAELLDAVLGPKFVGSTMMFLLKER
jgi:hypothetical protein